MIASKSSIGMRDSSSTYIPSHVISSRSWKDEEWEMREGEREKGLRASENSLRLLAWLNELTSLLLMHTHTYSHTHTPAVSHSQCCKCSRRWQDFRLRTNSNASRV